MVYCRTMATQLSPRFDAPTTLTSLDAYDLAEDIRQDPQAEPRERLLANAYQELHDRCCDLERMLCKLEADLRRADMAVVP